MSKSLTPRTETIEWTEEVAASYFIYETDDKVFILTEAAFDIVNGMIEDLPGWDIISRANELADIVIRKADGAVTKSRWF